MKRGIFYALAFLIILLLIGLLLPVSGPRSAGKKVMCRLEVENLNTAINQFKITFGKYPTGENSNIVGVLSGNNSQKIVFLNFRQTLEHPNEMVDPWNTPYKIEFFQQTNFVIRSAGKDKIFGDADDIIFNSVTNNFVKP